MKVYLKYMSKEPVFREIIPSTLNELKRFPRSISKQGVSSAAVTGVKLASFIIKIFSIAVDA